MKRDYRNPRGGLIVALCVVLAALWLVAAYGTYEESKREKYDVHITPGAVTYGTHSTATVPVVMTTTRHTSSVPMVSGSAVRNYAHYGHASMPSVTSSGKGLYTTSSATVHTIGSGGGAGGGGIASTAGASSSRGISYGGGSVSVPTLALATRSTYSSSRATAAMAEQTYCGIGPRKAKPEGDGTPGQLSDGGAGDDDWWYYDGEDWVKPPDGFQRSAGGGNFYKYIAASDEWILVDDKGNPIVANPIGDVPWWLLLCGICAYAIIKAKKQKKNS